MIPTDRAAVVGLRRDPTLGETGRVSIPLLSDIPVVGGRDSSDGSLFSQPAIVYVGLILVVMVAWMMRRTHMGLNIRAAGDKPLPLTPCHQTRSKLASTVCGQVCPTGAVFAAV